MGSNDASRGNLINLSEVAAPPPQTGSEQPQNEDIGNTTSTPYASQRSENHNSWTKVSEDYDLADAMENLDEVAAPSPISDRREGEFQRHEYLETVRSQSRARSRARSSASQAHQRRSLEEASDSESLEVDHVTSGALESEAKRSWRHRASKRLSLLYTLSYLVLFSFIGTITRLVIEGLTFYPGAPVTTSVLWANVAGCLVMGFLSEDFELFRVDVDKPVALSRTGEYQEQKEWRARYTKQKKAIPLYIGLTTGFCGCLTSFSSLMRDVFFAISNDLPVPIAQDTGVSLYRGPPPVYEAPNGGYSFMAVIAVIFAEVGLSLIALFVGAHVAIFAAKGMPTISSTFMKKFLDPLVLVLAPLVWVAIICLAALLPYPPPGIDTWSAMTWRGPSLFALAFAPLGCLTRFYLSIKFNGRFISFPFGTFLANAIGTMILGMAFALQHAPLSPAGSGLIGGSFAGCQVLQGVMDGFCGCLTTVSTWVLELSDSKREHAYIYGSVTVVVSLAALVLEMGSLRWTRGFESPTCFT